MRIAIYARYSSDLQHDRSIDDQVRLCTEKAKGLSGRVVEIYADRAISGANLRSRPDAMRLLKDAKAGAFDAVMTEALDRLSRDQEDIAAIHKRLRFAGVRLITAADGDINELHVGLKGTMNALFLTDLAAKVRRGQHGRVLAGYVPGGLSYGYSIERSIDERGELVRGKRGINEIQAAVVRRIFSDYVAGKSPRSIAAQLNREGIKSPSGRQWNASTINGNRERRNGILLNELYVGRLIYNRQSFVKDPETGKRVARPLPQDKWVIQEVPAQRIISQELWEQAQTIRGRFAGQAVHVTRRPKHLFSGLVSCASCGSAYIVTAPGALGCQGYRERGICTNKRRIRITALEERILVGLKQRMLETDALTTFLETYRQERRRLATEAARDRGAAEQRLAQVQRTIDRVVEAIAEMGISPARKEKLTKAEAEAADLRQRVQDAAQVTAVPELHPAAIDDYRRLVDELQAVLAGDGDDGARERMRSILRRLVRRIEVTPGDKRGEVNVRLIGELNELVQLMSGSAENAGRTETMVKVVAGTRNRRYLQLVEARL